MTTRSPDPFKPRRYKWHRDEIIEHISGGYVSYADYAALLEDYKYALNELTDLRRYKDHPHELFFK